MVTSGCFRWALTLFGGALLATTILSSSALAGDLEGRLTDSLTGTPIPDATVRVRGTTASTTTDERGRWKFDLPPGDYELEVEATLGDRQMSFQLVNQRVPQYKSADTSLPTTHYVKRGVPRRQSPLGAPVPRIDDPTVPDGGEVDLKELPVPSNGYEPNSYNLPGTPPTTLRVARRENKDTCRNSPIVAIEEVPLDEYVKGVLAPEIGVFRNQPNALEVFKAFAPAAKSYGLWFVLRYGVGNRRRVDSPKPPNDYEWFHIDDTPCNQRYSDMRFSTTDRGAEEMAGQILVKATAPDTLDKFEYAASCGGHGTRPEYQSAIVPDDSSTHSCVGDWCGHDSCAGHEDHPQVGGDDRCLVRGICQWGALEWAEAGRDAAWLLDHYQPNLELRDLSEPTVETVTVKGFVHTNPDDISGSGLPDATVQLGENRTTSSNRNGRYIFEDVEVTGEAISLVASKSGYTPNTRTTQLEAGQTNWVSIRLRPDSAMNQDVGGSDIVGRPDTVPADTNNAADAGQRIVTGPEPDETTGTYGGLGPAVAPSSGIGRSGCTIGGPLKQPNGRISLMVGLVAFGFIVVRSRRA